ncbi:ArsR/SmtB family transcription factor [Streptomyces sp. SID1121]|uniref:ArsR/SmtB family transcription factor n=1 Tax=Streptomyces sp. SID1121 TaxID=3425888 RepID=UPI004056EB3E
MRIRLHFTTEDLARLRIARGPDPLWEIVLSLNILANTQGRAVFDPWRARSRERLSGVPRPQARLLRYLAPGTGPFPDFLTPTPTAPDVATDIETVMTTPARQLRRDLGVLATAPSWARPLADADRTALAGLGDALHGYHHAAIAPLWPRIQALVDADRAVRARALLDHGTDGLLNSSRPTLRWSPPVLEADYPVDRDLHLAGRGLLLVPSVFCWRTPVTFIDDDLPPVLVYPVVQEPGWWGDPGRRAGRGALAAMLGPTRAAALRVIEDGCSTGELARRIGVTPPTASQHAAVLREARLVVSTRRNNTVIHTLTPLGAALLKENT